MMNSSSRKTRRDVWVNPSGSAFRTQDLVKISERKEEQSTTLNKYLWVSPDRKVQPGKISWAERRAAILDLQTAEDVAAALSRFVTIPISPTPPIHLPTKFRASITEEEAEEKTCELLFTKSFLKQKRSACIMYVLHCLTNAVVYLPTELVTVWRPWT
jgi:hypothetical protein